MELMFLLLGERIINSSIQVQYLISDPPNIRSKAVIPLYMIDSLDDDPCMRSQTYRDHFLSRFSNISQSILTQNHEFILKQTTHALNQFNSLIETITSSPTQYYCRQTIANYLGP